MLSFFFQAEDGIRDLTVTGVQTCALPISSRQRGWRRGGGGRWSASRDASPGRPPDARGSAAPRRAGPPPRRSEERRVGKECRSGWSPDDVKKDSSNIG